MRMGYFGGIGAAERSLRPFHRAPCARSALRALVGLPILLALAMPAGAQTSTAAAQGVFNAVEKKIIQDFFTKNKNPESLGQPAGATAGQAKKAKKGKKAKKAKKAKKGKKGKSGEMPPGLAKRKTLPPGLAKQLERNGTLPPGLAKRDLPSGLAAALPKTKRGRQRLIVGDDVLLVETATGLILDILRGAASGN